MSKLPIISPAAVPAAASGSKAMVPVPTGRSAHEPRPLLAIEGYRARQFGTETRQPTARYDRSGRDAGVVLDADYVAAGRPADPFAAAAFNAQLLGRAAATGDAYLTGFRSAMAQGSEAYRRAGAEPSLVPEAASVVNLAV